MSVHSQMHTELLCILCVICNGMEGASLWQEINKPSMLFSVRFLPMGEVVFSLKGQFHTSSWQVFVELLAYLNRQTTPLKQAFYVWAVQWSWLCSNCSLFHSIATLLTVDTLCSVELKISRVNCKLFCHQLNLV